MKRLTINKIPTKASNICQAKLYSGESCDSILSGLHAFDNMAMVAVISVDACLFLAFSDLTCHLEDTGIGVFWLQCAAK